MKKNINIIYGLLLTLVIYTLPLSFLTLCKIGIFEEFDYVLFSMIIISINLLFFILIFLSEKENIVKFEYSYFIIQLILLIPLFILKNSFLSDEIMRLYFIIILFNVALLIACIFYNLFRYITLYGKSKK